MLVWNQCLKALSCFLFCFKHAHFSFRVVVEGVIQLQRHQVLSNTSTSQYREINHVFVHCEYT